MEADKREAADGEEYYCDFCGQSVAEEEAEFSWEVMDIYVMCPRCAARARELRRTLPQPGTGPGARPEGPEALSLGPEAGPMPEEPA